MIAIKSARKTIENDPGTADARILADLVLSLENESPFPLADLYHLGQKNFALALDILGEWRIDRYYAGKAKLFDISWQHRESRAPAASA